MNAPTGEIKRGRKFDQVIEGARAVFMADGFEGASVDDIAKAAGVSKATLYSYFPDKRILFMEVASTECERQAEDAMDQIDMGAGPREVLLQMADRMMCFFLSPFGRAVFRIVVAEADRFPEIGRHFWDHGPGRGREIMKAYFVEAIARGELAIPDTELAAAQFSELCKADLHTRLVLGLVDGFGADDRRRIAEAAVDMFLARYGAAF